jgi:hypothetical protein
MAGATRACLGYNQLIDIESQIKEVSRGTLYVSITDSTHCINKAIECSESSDTDHITEVLKSLRTN